MFLSIYKTAGIFSVRTFPTINRVTIPIDFDGSFTTVPLVDGMVLAGLAVAAFCVATNRKVYSIAAAAAYVAVVVIAGLNQGAYAEYLLFFSGAAFVGALIANRYRMWEYRAGAKRFARASILYMLIFEIGALVRWLIHPFYTKQLFAGSDWHLTFMESQLYYLAALGSAAMLLILIYSLAIRLNISSNRLQFLWKEAPHDGRSKRSWLYLALISGTAFAMPFYPYLPALNPTSYLVSVDIRYYDAWLDSARDGGISALFVQGTSPGDRPFSLIVLYVVSSVIQSRELVLQFAPVIFAPAFSIATYLLVREGLRSERYALLSAILAIASYTTLVGVYAGLYANWMANIVGIFVFFFLIRYIKRGKSFDFMLFAIFSTVVFFFHTFAGYFFMTSVGMFLILSLVFRSGISRRNMALIAITVAIAFAINYSKSIIVETPDSISEAQLLLSTTTSIENFASRWFTLNFVMKLHEGGIFGNTVMLGLAAIWAITVNLKNHFERLCFAPLPFVAFLFLFGDITLQGRLLYVLPVMLYATMGIFRLFNIFNMSPRNKIILVSLLGTFFFNYLMRTLSNLYLVLPT